jgi:hypothetical protein
MRLLRLVALAAGCVLALGCGGDRLIQTPCRLVKGGQPFIPKEGESIQVTFVPIAPDGKPPADLYYADVDQSTGTFKPAGKNRKGMPPGKYRVAVELMKKKKDQFGGKFNEDKSPFVFDFDPTTPEVVIDLDSPPK